VFLALSSVDNVYSSLFGRVGSGCAFAACPNRRYPAVLTRKQPDPPESPQPDNNW
jgi:hypothetical protein